MPHVLQCLTCFVLFMLSCFMCLVPYVLSCLMCLLCYVFLCLTCLLPYVLSAWHVSYLTFCYFWRASCLMGSCSSRASCLTCYRSSRASCLTGEGLTCFVFYVLPCSTSFIAHLSHVTCALRVLMRHLLCVLSALVPSVPRLLQVSHAQQCSCISCLVALVSRTWLLRFWYYSYLSFFLTWAMINHSEKQLLLKESCCNYFLY